MKNREVTVGEKSPEELAAQAAIQAARKIAEASAAQKEAIKIRGD